MTGPSIDQTDDRGGRGDRLRTAQGDALVALGRIHEPYGGGVAELPGIRLSSSGLPYRQWNTGDVDDPPAVDLRRVRDWYAAQGVPWGVRVPAGLQWTAGVRLFRQRLMGLHAPDLRPLPPVPGLGIEPAGVQDLADVVRIDAAAFGADPVEQRAWIEPHLGAAGVTTALARLDGVPAATAYIVLAEGRAGRTACLAGVAVAEWARRRGVAAAVSSWLLARAFEAGARLAHLHPDTDEAAHVYARLGFLEVDGFDVYVDLS